VRSPSLRGGFAELHACRKTPFDSSECGERREVDIVVARLRELGEEKYIRECHSISERALTSLAGDQALE
jgi:hypothetical protein